MLHVSGFRLPITSVSRLKRRAPAGNVSFPQVRYFLIREIIEMSYKLFMFISIVGLLLIGAEQSIATENIPLTDSQLLKLTLSQDRHEGDYLRDNDRRPSKILKFSEVSSGDVVLDLYAGGGWYTELFSMAVGSNGKVYAHNDSLTWRFGHKELVERTINNRLSNVTRIDQVDITEIDIPNSSVDIAFMGINYHDLFFTHRVRNGRVEKMRESIVDYERALSKISKLLKRNGVLIITDHFAKPGSGYRAANDLHRIDPDIVKHQLEQSGFELLEEAFYLRNPEDDLSTLVFDSKIRGKTSRFVYKFGRASKQGDE